MFFLVTLFFLSLTQIALGQVPTELPLLPPDAFIEHSFLETILSGAFFAKMLPVVVATQVLLYGVAEGLTRLSVLTENKWDNKASEKLSELAWLLGVVIGKFGYSTPKLVVQEHIEQAKEKQVSTPEGPKSA